MVTKYSQSSLVIGIATSLLLPLGIAAFHASAALAQIPVTGGNITGDAGFFVPDIGNTVIFDAGTRTLRLETPNGVTVDSRFFPTYGSLNPIGNRLPGFGDTGNLSGLLSGRAFDPAGDPYFFSTPTTLNFSLNYFLSDTVFRGTLITPTSSIAIATTPRAFLPVDGVILNPFSSFDFSANPGFLYIGAFDANLPSGLIALPPVVQFGTPLVTEFAVPDIVVRTLPTINFQLQGQGTPNFTSVFDPIVTGAFRYDNSFDPFAFVTFNVQIAGTPLSIGGSGRTSIIEVSNSTGIAAPRDIFGNFLGFSGSVGFNVSGQGSGTIFDLSSNFNPPPGLAPNSVGFAGNSYASFDLRDSFGGYIIGQGNLTGFNVIGVFPVISSFSSFPGVTPPTFNTVEISNLGVNLAAAPVIPPPSLLIGLIGLSGDTSGSSDSVSSNPTSDIFISGVISSSYEYINTTEIAYAAVGLPSRVFPGLSGYEAVETEESAGGTDTSSTDSSEDGVATSTSSTDSNGEEIATGTSSTDWVDESNEEQAEYHQSWADWYVKQAEEDGSWSAWHEEMAAWNTYQDPTDSGGFAKYHGESAAYYANEAEDHLESAGAETAEASYYSNSTTEETGSE